MGRLSKRIIGEDGETEKRLLQIAKELEELSTSLDRGAGGRYIAPRLKELSDELIKLHP